MNYHDLSNLVRIEDLPYYTSPPMQFTFVQKADLTLGEYPFTAGRATIGNNKNITDNTLLYIKAMTFSADIPILHYQEALQLATGDTDIPRFSVFLQSDSNAPIFIDPIQLSDYFDDQEYKKLVLPKQFPNRMSAFFRGTLQQTGNLAGVTEINLTINLWVQQISDDTFINGLKKKYPDLMNGEGY